MAKTNYPERLSLPLDGDDVTLFASRTSVHLATGYKRIVIGDRGPYVEFEARHLLLDRFRDVDLTHHYYYEMRSVHDNVKLYHQINGVDYADYVPGLYYISPFDLCTVDGVRVITELREKHG